MSIQIPAFSQPRCLQANPAVETLGRRGTVSPGTTMNMTCAPDARDPLRVPALPGCGR